MSENNLKIRQKFLKKLQVKIADLEEDLELLHRVDRKIIRHSFKQTGGEGETVNLQNIQQKAAFQVSKIKAQQEALTKAADSINALTTKLKSVKDALSGLGNLLDSLQVSAIQIPDTSNIPNFNTYQNKALINAYKNIPFDEMRKIEGEDEAVDFNAELPDARIGVDESGLSYGLDKDKYEELRSKIHAEKDVTGPAAEGAAPAESGESA